MYYPCLFVKQESVPEPTFVRGTGEEHWDKLKKFPKQHIEMWHRSHFKPILADISRGGNWWEVPKYLTPVMKVSSWENEGKSQKFAHIYSSTHAYMQIRDGGSRVGRSLRIKR